MRSDMGLTVTDIACSRSGRPVLRDLSFDATDGDVIVLRGPNGAGKSTLLRALCGLLPLDAGRVELDGMALGGDTDGYVEAIAHAGHLDAIKPQLTVAENLAFWTALFGGTPTDAARARATFDLDGIADRPAQACSAGQKRRLGLARLLVAPRRLWLLDEPTVSLDAAATARLIEAIRLHSEGGGIAVIATHIALDLAGTRDLRLDPITGHAARREIDPFLAGEHL